MAGDGNLEKACGDAIDMRYEVWVGYTKFIRADSNKTAMLAMQADQMVVVLIRLHIKPMPDICKVGKQWAWITMETAVEVVADGLYKQAQGSNSKQDDGRQGQANGCWCHLWFLSDQRLQALCFDWVL
ncbi:MAG: hypothetical protein Q9221_008382 [Calogaya cf. arnoldii]